MALTPREAVGDIERVKRNALMFTSPRKAPTTIRLAWDVVHLVESLREAEAQVATLTASLAEWQRRAEAAEAALAASVAVGMEAAAERDRWHALADERNEDLVKAAVRITSMESDLGQLARGYESVRDERDCLQKQVAAVRGLAERLERGVEARWRRGLGGGTRGQIARDLRTIVGGDPA